MVKARRLLPVLALTAGLLAGCAARSVQIAQLKSQPERYDDKTVSVTGVVTSSFGVPLIPFQFYNIDDGTGEITVVSRSNRAPSKGSRVEVRGKISEIAVFGGRSIGLHIDETNRRIRG
jgi:hypothetical protein